MLPSWPVVVPAQPARAPALSAPVVGSEAAATSSLWLNKRARPLKRLCKDLGKQVNRFLALSTKKMIGPQRSVAAALHCLWWRATTRVVGLCVCVCRLRTVLASLLLARVSFGLQGEPALNMDSAVALGIAEPHEKQVTSGAARSSAEATAMRAVANSLGHTTATLARNYLGKLKEAQNAWKLF